MGEPEVLDGESVAVDAESSWTERLGGFRFRSSVRSGGRTRLCCLSLSWFGVAAVVVAITRSEVVVCKLPNICPPLCLPHSLTP